MERKGQGIKQQYGDWFAILGKKTEKKTKDDKAKLEKMETKIQMEKF